MFCSNCGKEVGKNALFCSNCGIKLTYVEEKERGQEFVENLVSEKNDVDTENNNDQKRKPASVLKTMLLLICIAVTVTGISYVKRMFYENEVERERQEREKRIHNTLEKLGNRSCGSESAITVNASMELNEISNVVLGNTSSSGQKRLRAEKTKENTFQNVKRYFEGGFNCFDYAALILGADYFEKEDIEYLCGDMKVNAAELKQCVEYLLFKSDIPSSTLLINEMDEKICYTMSLRIRLAQDGYIGKKDIAEELYQFVCEGRYLKAVPEWLLDEEISYEQIATDVDGNVFGYMYLYEELSEVGKLVFLYLMPRYIEQIDQELAVELWYYFGTEYEKCWNEIIGRDIFSGMIE